MFLGAIGFFDRGRRPSRTVETGHQVAHDAQAEGQMVVGV
jgi:hypothetical protein